MISLLIKPNNPNVFTPNSRASKYVKQKLRELKVEILKSMIRVGTLISLSQ